MRKCIALTRGLVSSRKKGEKIDVFMTYLGAFLKRKLTAALRQHSTGAVAPLKTASPGVIFGEL